MELAFHGGLMLRRPGGLAHRAETRIFRPENQPLKQEAQELSGGSEPVSQGAPTSRRQGGRFWGWEVWPCPAF